MVLIPRVVALVRVQSRTGALASRIRLGPAVLLAISAACQPDELYAPPSADPVVALIEPRDAVHHFGSVVATSDRILRHGYALHNHTDHAVTIVRVINRLPCCGTVTLTRDRLEPGESTEVGVVIRVGGRFGELNHETSIETDQPSPDPLILSTRATLYPPVRVEQSPADGDGSRSFQVSAYGTEQEPPVDLDHLTLATRLQARWLGAATMAREQDGLLASRRQFRVELDQDGSAGIRRETVTLCQSGSPIYEHPLTWEVIPSVEVSPSSLPWKSGQRAYSLILKSRDGSPFQITGVESTWTLTRWSAEETGTAGIQKLAVEIDRADSHARRGELVISTNREDRPSIVVPVLALD